MKNIKKIGLLSLSVIQFILICCLCIVLYTKPDEAMAITNYTSANNNAEVYLISSGDCPGTFDRCAYSIYRVKIDGEYKYFMTTYSPARYGALSTIQIE